MSVFLRVAAVLALLRAVGFFCFKSILLGPAAVLPLLVALVNGLAAANLGLAFVFWRAAGRPTEERTGVYAALIISGLRAVGGTYEVLFLLEGGAAIVSLIDMVANIALFVGILNVLPVTLRGRRESGIGSSGSESGNQNLQ